MKFLLVIFSVFCFLFLAPAKILAIYNPVSVANNRFGIHITDENDLEDARNLVNTNGGDWGYVTLVIRDDQLDQSKWQNNFDSMRRLHLIPILRLATHQTKTGWAAPTAEDANKWADFLNSLNWVIQNRYVVLFNEPNHAAEWGGEISPSEYSQVVTSFSKALKEKSADYFILSAGMDMSAPNSKTTMDSFRFWKLMYAADKSVFTKFDGIASHSYPNPGFVGSTEDSGPKSILGFEDEVDFLKDYGLNPDIPIFITETGWIHREGVNQSPNAPLASDIANNFEIAFDKVWRKQNIIAVTPFILNYSSAPFDHFSFKSSSGEFYSAYEVIQKIPKVSGKPKQINSAEILNDVFPDSLISDSNYLLQLKIKNTGQTIWDEEGIKIKISGDFPLASADKILYTEPGKEAVININLKTPEDSQNRKINAIVYYKDQQLLPEISKEIKLIPPTTLNISVILSFKVNKNFTADLLIYDGDRIIKKLNNILFSHNVAKIMDLRDVIPGRVYRFVITKAFYLPQQTYQYVDKIQTEVKFTPLLPLDFDSDGKLSISDLPAALTYPLATIKLFSPF